MNSKSAKTHKDQKDFIFCFIERFCSTGIEIKGPETYRRRTHTMNRTPHVRWNIHFNWNIRFDSLIRKHFAVAAAVIRTTHPMPESDLAEIFRFFVWALLNGRRTYFAAMWVSLSLCRFMSVISLNSCESAFAVFV